MSSAIQKILSTNVLEVHNEACKNYGNQQNVCQACVDVCAEEAVLLNDGTPTIIDTKCIDCGACVGACFVQAIDHLYKPYVKVKEYMKNFPKAHITCDQVEEFNQGIKVPCLLYLDIPLLSQYEITREDVHIYVGQCRDCNKICDEKVLVHLNELERELTQLGFSMKVNVNDTLPKEEDGQLVNAVSRRDILKSFSLTSIRELLLPSRHKEETTTEDKFEILSVQDRMRLKKETLNEFLLVENMSQSSQSYYPTIKVNEQCNGCNVCETICPTNALRWKGDGDSSHLMFEAGKCVGCDKCLACPQKALSIFRNFREEDLTKKPLITMKVSHCEDCGDTVKSAKKETHCFFCEAKSKKDPIRFFTT